MNEFTPIERMTVGNDGSVRVEMGYTHDMLDKMAALISRKVDEELMKRIAPQFGYVKEQTCHNLKAEWPSLFECDECGYDNSDTYTGSEPNFKFCPNCGAKVVKE